MVGDFFTAGAADGAEGIVVDFAAGDDWNFRVQQLREAANRFMSEMARNTPDAKPEDQNAQAQDLDKMMDQMEESARNGSREDAQAMLDQMQ